MHRYTVEAKRGVLHLNLMVSLASRWSLIIHYSVKEMKKKKSDRILNVTHQLMHFQYNNILV